LHRKACRRRKLLIHSDNLIRIDDQDRSFCDDQRINWNVASNEKITTERAAVGANVPSIDTC